MQHASTIKMAHGGGGRLSRELIRDEILSRFGSGPLEGLPDGARLPGTSNDLVFTTDSFVVQPVEFPGGNIGHLAVHGTVNDLAVSGAVPRWLSLALILEEGLQLDLLRRVLDAVRNASNDAGVTVVTGDIKVVASGQCDGCYINTAGIGHLLPGFDLSEARIQAGDAVLCSGTLADHGMAVMTAREDLGIRQGPLSDTAPVRRLVEVAAPHASSVRFMRDPTRGGAAATLNEAVEHRPLQVVLQETDIPLAPATRAVAELLGIDPLHVASEGRLLLICAPDAAAPILEAWRRLPEGAGCAQLGYVQAAPGPEVQGRVVMATASGGTRLVTVPRGELLPRIC